MKIEVEVYINNVFSETVLYAEDDFYNTEIGAVIKIGKNEYTVISKDDNKLYLG